MPDKRQPLTRIDRRTLLAGGGLIVGATSLARADQNGAEAARMSPEQMKELGT